MGETPFRPLGVLAALAIIGAELPERESVSSAGSSFGSWGTSSPRKAFASVPRPCDLSSVIRDAVEAASRDAQSREVQLVCEVPTSSLARVDPEAIRQAVDNLLTNALKVAPEGSAVRVSLTDDDTTLTLSVEDEGPGITDEREIASSSPFSVAEPRKVQAPASAWRSSERSRRDTAGASLSTVPRATQARGSCSSSLARSPSHRAASFRR